MFLFKSAFSKPDENMPHLSPDHQPVQNSTKT